MSLLASGAGSLAGKEYMNQWGHWSSSGLFDIYQLPINENTEVGKGGGWRWGWG
jgi:hypothetical protein